MTDLNVANPSVNATHVTSSRALHRETRSLLHRVSFKYTLGDLPGPGQLLLKKQIIQSDLFYAGSFSQSYAVFDTQTSKPAR